MSDITSNTTNKNLISIPTLKAQTKLIDEVESVMLSLFENEEFRALLTATNDEAAVEGSTDIDDVMASKMIRDQAAKIGNALVAMQNLNIIKKKFRAATRRYDTLSRKTA